MTKCCRPNKAQHWLTKPGSSANWPRSWALTICQSSQRTLAPLRPVFLHLSGKCRASPTAWPRKACEHLPCFSVSMGRPLQNRQGFCQIWTISKALFMKEFQYLTGFGITKGLSPTHVPMLANMSLSLAWVRTALGRPLQPHITQALCVPFWRQPSTKLGRPPPPFQRGWYLQRWSWKGLKLALRARRQSKMGKSNRSTFNQAARDRP